MVLQLLSDGLDLSSLGLHDHLKDNGVELLLNLLHQNSLNSFGEERICSVHDTLAQSFFQVAVIRVEAKDLVGDAVLVQLCDLTADLFLYQRLEDVVSAEIRCSV